MSMQMYEKKLKASRFWNKKSKPAILILMSGIAEKRSLGAVGHSIVRYIGSPAWRSVSSVMRRCIQMPEFTTCPRTLFSPTRMQPRVSLCVLPAWMRMAEKLGTPSSIGSHLPSISLLLMTMGYRPSGMADLPFIFFPPCS